jgi:Tol biopolymer transport system component
VGFGDYAWSPDGRYVALALKLKPNIYPNLYPMSKSKTSYRFAVLDTATQEVTDYCIPNTTLVDPVWSPDGRQVLIEDNRSISENNVFMIDIFSNVAFHIAESVTPVGWLIEP